jgi:carbamoyl-phosphate synthase large subunit
VAAVTRPLNVLVLGVGGNVSQSIQKALRLVPLEIRLLAACISPASTGLHVADRAFISPLAADPDFVPWLLELCAQERIDAVLSGSEIVLETIAPHAAEIELRTGAVCIVSTPDVLRTGRDKLLTARWLESKGLPVPGYADLADVGAVASLVEKCGFPLIAKPRYGKGGDGILIVRDRSDLDRVLGAEDLSLRELVGETLTASDLVLQQYLGSERDEYTAGCFCDRSGRLLGTIVMRRRLHAGTTVAAELGEFPEVSEVAGAIAAALGPLGPCNVQLRVHDGNPIPFEINPRFSGTTAMRARMGFNEVETALRHFVLGEDAAAMEPRPSGVALRYWNELYVPAAAISALSDHGVLDAPSVHVEDWGRDR